MEVWVRVLILVACLYPVMVECAVRRFQFNVSNFAFQFEKRMIKSQTAWSAINELIVFMLGNLNYYLNYI